MPLPKLNSDGVGPLTPGLRGRLAIVVDTFISIGSRLTPEDTPGADRRPEVSSVYTMIKMEAPVSTAYLSPIGIASRGQLPMQWSWLLFQNFHSHVAPTSRWHQRST